MAMFTNWYKYWGSRRDETKPEDSRKKALELPWSVSNYQYALKSLGHRDSDDKKTEETPPEVQKIVKYSGAALKTGRPINKVVLVLVGDVGAGKSLTLNRLFHDGLCATRYDAPETQKVTEYGKELYVTTEQPTVKGTLSFVDTPGFNIKDSGEAGILDLVLSYRQNSVDLKDRHESRQENLSVRGKVYPNAVLLVVRASDQPFVGENSNLWKKLKRLARCEIVDVQHVNLIVVVTHAMSLSCVEKRYQEICEVLTSIIQGAVNNVLFIPYVKVVFIENMPEDFAMTKAENSRYYKLPNGRLSHCNLTQALADLFKECEDNLGNLLCSWYFSDNCPQKTDEPTKIISAPVDLPCSLKDFQERREVIGLPWEVRKRSPEGQLLIKYSGTALETGRPLNKVMILMAGQSGAGKSTTINSLFNSVVCAISADRSITRTVTEYGVDLCVTAESPPVRGTLSFVDIPGSLDVDQSKEGVNLALISNFREKHADLARRKGLSQRFLPISEEVFPNLVLFIVQAGDNRMVGPDSHLTKSLKTLRQCRLLDRECTNLIVVVTHAAHLAIKEDIYRKKCGQTKSKIRNAVWDVLQIIDVKVVFVENNPEEFGMVKGEGSDFYRLPDGQLSHFNLIQAINDHFKKNGDYLGRLLCSWYFADSCPEKQTEPNVLHSVQGDLVSPEETQEALEKLNAGMQAASQDDGVPTFRFQYLGRGYCPKTETMKNVNVYSGTETKQVQILGKKYVVPKCVERVEKSETYHNQLSSKTRDKYEKNRHASYGLEADITLVVNVDSRGRWVQDESSENVQSLVTILHETRLANVRMDEPEKNVKEKLRWALGYLPTHYNEETAYIFNEFFSKWGSHFICEEWIGGFIKVEHSVTALTYNEKQEQEISKRVQCAIKGINLPANAELGAGSTGTESKQHDMQEDTLIISGGEAPTVKSLTDLTPSIMALWVDSIKSNPTELLYSVKLYPYYHLTEGMGKTALRDATVDYLGDTMARKLKIRRDDLSHQYLADVKNEECDKNCFPPSARVYTKSGMMEMKDLKPNSDVLTFQYKTAPDSIQLGFGEVFTFLHYDPHKRAEFLVIHLQNGQTLTVTCNHLIFFCDDGVVREKRAKHVKVGDELIVFAPCSKFYEEMVPGLIQVDNITKTSLKGVYSPLTHTGTLVVDGVSLSCYSNIESHKIAHLSMAPLRWWHTVHRTVNNRLHDALDALVQPNTFYKDSFRNKLHQSQVHSNIHVYAKVLMAVCNILPVQILQDI